MEVFVYPLLQKFGLYTPSDPTYGRYLLDFPVYEKELAEDPDIRTKQRRIFVQNGKFLQGEDISLTKDEIESAKRKEWVYYRVWEKGPGNGCDVIALHGINDYGGKWALHISGLLSKGFRVIAPDMPSFGRSTGLHSYILTHKQLISTIESVILDVDTYSSPTRKIFLIGSSMGGGLILHPTRTRITGAYVLCPMIAISPETRPHIVVETLGQIMKFVAGRLPILSVVRGNLSDDPRVEEEIQNDPRVYSAKMRLSTASAMLKCLLEFTHSVNASFDTPFCIGHGTHDRVTAHKGSMVFVENAASKDKGIVLYEGAEHVLLKVIDNEEEDETRTKVLADMEDWLVKRTVCSSSTLCSVSNSRTFTFTMARSAAHNNIQSNESLKPPGIRGGMTKVQYFSTLNESRMKEPATPSNGVWFQENCGTQQA